MLDYLSFYAPGLPRRRKMLPRFDVVATLTTPPIIGLIGTILRKVEGVAGMSTGAWISTLTPASPSAGCRPATRWSPGSPG